MTRKRWAINPKTKRAFQDEEAAFLAWAWWTGLWTIGFFVALGTSGYTPGKNRHLIWTTWDTITAIADATPTALGFATLGAWCLCRWLKRVGFPIVRLEEPLPDMREEHKQ